MIFYHFNFLSALEFPLSIHSNNNSHNIIMNKKNDDFHRMLSPLMGQAQGFAFICFIICTLSFTCFIPIISFNIPTTHFVGEKTAFDEVTYPKSHS